MGREFDVKGAALRRVRQERLLSRAEFAIRVGATPNTVYKIEECGQQPSAALLRRICDALECTYGDLSPEAEAQEVGA